MHTAPALTQPPAAPDCGDSAAAQPIGSTAFDAVDRLAVVNLINSYGYLADNFGSARFDELFATDATVQLHAGDKVLVEGLVKFKDFVGRRHEKLASEKIQRRHVLSAPRFDFQDSSSASGQAYLRYYETKSGAAPALMFVGTYSFRAVKADGNWKLACWIARTDG